MPSLIFYYIFCLTTVHHISKVHHMQRRFGNRKAVTVYLDEGEYAHVVKKAGPGKVSAWVRERILGLDEKRGGPKSTVAQRSEDTEQPASIPAEAAKGPAVPSNYLTEKCSHGATRYRCQKWGCKFYEIANGRG